MKKALAVISALIAVCLLAGCAGLPSKEKPTEKETKETTTVKLRDEAIAETAKVTFERKSLEDAKEMAKITGIDADGNEIWVYETEASPVGELSMTEEIGVSEAGYLFNDAGTIRCLGMGKRDGGIQLWENDEFGGGSICFDFTGKGDLCIAGQYGPTLMIIGPDGLTKALYEDIDKDFTLDFYWPDKIEVRKEGIYIHSAGLDFGVTVDPDTGKVLSMDEISLDRLDDMLEGVWVDDLKDPVYTFGLNYDGGFKAYRKIQKDSSMPYEGKWRIGEFDGNNVLYLDLNEPESKDPLMKGFTSLGDFAVTKLYVKDGVIAADLSQVNNGDSLFSMADEDFPKHDYTITLYKVAGNNADYEFPAVG